MSRRVFSLFKVLIMFTAVFILAGCGLNNQYTISMQNITQSEKIKKDIPKTDEKVTIRILTRLSSNQPNAVAFRERVKDFQILNLNIAVEDLSIEDENSYDTKLQAAIATGDVPELFATYGGAAFENYARYGIAADLTEALNADKAWSDAFLPVFENFRYDDPKGIYAVPYEFYAIGIFYNKDLFQRIGERPPRTIKEFEKVCDKFKAIGIIPMSLGEKDNWRAGHLFCNLLDKRFSAQKNMDLASRKAKYDDPDMVELFKLIADWNRNGYFGENIVTLEHTTEKGLFHSEKTAMHMNGSWYVPEASASRIADKIGFTPFPYFDDKPENKDVWMGGAGGAFAISGKAEPAKKEAAIKLLKFVTSPEAFMYYQKIQKGGVFPVKLELNPDIVDKLTIEYADSIRSAKFKAEVYNYDPIPNMTDIIRNELQGMLAGQDPEVTSRKIQTVIDKSLVK